MQLDFEAKLGQAVDRLEELAAEMGEALRNEAEARADYEEAFHTAVVVSDKSSAVAREQEARQATIKLRRAHLLAEAKVKALKSAQSAVEAVVSALQTLARGVYRAGG